MCFLSSCLYSAMCFTCVTPKIRKLYFVITNGVHIMNCCLCQHVQPPALMQTCQGHKARLPASDLPGAQSPSPRVRSARGTKPVSRVRPARGTKPVSRVRPARGNSYIALYPVNIYKLAALYIITIKIRMTIKKVQVL